MQLGSAGRQRLWILTRAQLRFTCKTDGEYRSARVSLRGDLLQLRSEPHGRLTTIAKWVSRETYYNCEVSLKGDLLQLRSEPHGRLTTMAKWVSRETYYNCEVSLTGDLLHLRSEPQGRLTTIAKWASRETYNCEVSLTGDLLQLRSEPHGRLNYNCEVSLTRDLLQLRSEPHGRLTTTAKWASRETTTIASEPHTAIQPSTISYCSGELRVHTYFTFNQHRLIRHGVINGECTTEISDAAAKGLSPIRRHSPDTHYGLHPTLHLPMYFPQPPPAARHVPCDEFPASIRENVGHWLFLLIAIFKPT